VSVTVKDLTNLADAVKVALGKIEARVAKLEESKAIAYRGVYIPGEEYECGDFVTAHGSLFCCLRDTKDPPDGRSSAWKLAVKGP